MAHGWCVPFSWLITSRASPLLTLSPALTEMEMILPGIWSGQAARVLVGIFLGVRHGIVNLQHLHGAVGKYMHVFIPEPTLADASALSRRTRTRYWRGARRFGLPLERLGLAVASIGPCLAIAGDMDIAQCLVLQQRKTPAGSCR